MDLDKKKAVKAEPEPKLDSQKPPSGRSWEHIESDLKDALNTWSDLTEELAGKMSPEEAQLQEIKSLLGTLRDKLQEFSEDTAGENLTSESHSDNNSQNKSK